MYSRESSSRCTGAAVAAAEMDGWHVGAEDKGAGARKKPWMETASSSASRRQSDDDEVEEEGMLMLAGALKWGLPVWCRDGV